MKVFYVPCYNDISIENYNNTVLKRININQVPVHTILNEERGIELSNVGIWAFTHNYETSGNAVYFKQIEVGDVLLFLMKDEEGYQCINSIGYITYIFTDDKLGEIFWQDRSYTDFICFDKLIQLEIPFRLTRDKKIVGDLEDLPSEFYNTAYVTFKLWPFYQKDNKGKRSKTLKYIEEEVFIQKLFEKNGCKYIYGSNVNLEQIDECDYTNIGSVRDAEGEYLIEGKYDIEDTSTITETEKDALIKRRIGHGKLKSNLLQREGKCILCGLSDKRFLIASHIKPWRESNEQERLDIENVLLLCPHHDAVFDKGFISFDEEGRLLISHELSLETRALLNIFSEKKISLNDKQKVYLEWHRQNLFRK